MKEFIESLRPYTKSILAGITGALQIVALYLTLSADGRVSPEDLNAIIGAVIIALGGTGLVYQLPNKK